MYEPPKELDDVVIGLENVEWYLKRILAALEAVVIMTEGQEKGEILLQVRLRGLDE